MMTNSMKKLNTLMLTIMMVIALMGIFSVSAKAETSNEGQLYDVDFNFDPEDYKGTINSIGLTGEFLFYNSNLTGNTDKTGMNDVQTKYIPSQYQSNMSSVGGFYYQEMKYDESKKVYTTSLKLPAGVYNYHFIINGTLGEPDTGEMSWSNVYAEDGKLHGLKFTFDNWLTDPKNKPNVPTPTGAQNNSELYVGTSDECAWIPNSDLSKRGTVTFNSYTDVNNTTQYLGVYLPVGYDKNAPTPYKVIFVSHGGGGNENDWYSQGGINNIMDNLIAQGKTKNAIVVTMNNANYATADRKWDFAKIADNLFNHIIPYIEKVYNISTNVNDRAFAGLSMGSLTTTYLYQHYPLKFGYFGGFSGALAGGEGFDLSSPDLEKTVLMIGSGEEDMAYNTTEIGVPTFIKELEKRNIKYIAHFVPGAHDWFAWPQLFTHFAENVLWSEDTTNSESVQAIPSKRGVSGIMISILVLLAVCAGIGIVNRKKTI